MADVSEILLLLSGDAAGAKRAISETKGGLTGLGAEGEHTGGVFSKLGKIIVGAMAIAGGAALGAAGAGVAAYVEISGAQDKLNVAMKAAGPAGTQSQTAIDKTVKSLNNLGLGSADALKAMTKLTEAHVPLKDQTAALTAAQNLAVATGMDFSSALTAVLMGSQGAGRALKQYGLNLPIPITSSKALATATAKVTIEQDKLTVAEKKYGDNSPQAIAARKNLTDAQKKLTAATESYNNKFAALPGLADQVNKRFGGQAAAWQKTLPGVLNQLKIKWEEMAYSIGKVLVPYLITAGKWFISIEPTVANLVKNGLTVLGNAIKFIASNFKIFGPILLGVIAGFVAFKTAMLIQALIEGVSGAVGILSGVYALLTTGEAGAATAADALAISEGAALAPFLAIGLAIAAVVAGFILLYTHVTGFRNVVNAVFSWVVGFIKTAVGIVIAVFKVTPFGFLITHLTEIKNFVANTWNAITGALKIVWRTIGNDVAAAWGGVVSVIKGAVNIIIGVIDTVIGGINKVTGAIPFVGAKLQIPLIPRWSAAGAFVDRPTVIGAGEGGPETVLNRRQFQAMMVGAPLRAVGGRGVGGGAGGGLVISPTYNFPPGMRASDRAVIRQEIDASHKDLLHHIAAARA
jgi:hypothetical protein